MGYIEETAEQYHADKTHITASMLKMMHLKSPAHVYAEFFDPNRPERVETPAMRLGSLIHKVCLEPESFDDEYIVMPSGLDRRTKEGKQLWADLQASGKTVLRDEEFSQVKGVRDAVLKNEWFTGLLKDKNIVREKTIKERKLMKARPDLMLANPAPETGGLIVDVKSTTDASPEGFGRQIAKLGYLVQAAHYCHIYKVVYGLFGRPTEFVFFAVEKNYPYICQPYLLTSEQIEIGNTQWMDVLDSFGSCEETGLWPAFSEYGSKVPEEAVLPNWVYSELEDDLQITTGD